MFAPPETESRYTPLPEHTSAWKRLRESVRYALAMPPPLELAPADREVLAKLATMLVRRRLGSPALMVLEMSRPINFVASQFLVFMKPFATALLNPTEYERFVRILEHREGIDALVEAITNGSENGAATVQKTQPSPLTSSVGCRDNKTHVESKG
ncbi:MAG TPA: hypothetical protein P5569_02070 [Candidatus Latescibacteria bacterium]|nr:hypothetical protein [Candidatus Latescibacterota bacterium]